MDSNPLGCKVRAEQNHWDKSSLASTKYTLTPI
jgi:hypothetical protein